LRFFSW